LNAKIPTKFTSKPSTETTINSVVFSSSTGCEILSIASATMLTDIPRRRHPFANPDTVSTLPRPYGNLVDGGNFDRILATKPTSRAKQSKNM
jgi:hypothetical protein